MTTLTTLKRAWNLAATLLLCSPALGEAGVALVTWTLAAALGYAAWHLGVILVIDRLAPTSSRHGGSIPPTSTHHLKEDSMNHERSHLNVRLEIQLRTVELAPGDLEAADELERIRVQLLALDLEEQK